VGTGYHTEIEGGGAARAGAEGAGPGWLLGHGEKRPAQEGGGGRRAGRARRWWFGLLSLLFFLSLFYFFPDFQTQIYLNSDKL
jgi:hypothetical protein